MNRETDIEEWRDVPGYEGLYKVSNKGGLVKLEHWSSKGRYYPESCPYQFKNYKGYIQTYLYKDGKRKTTTIHRLIAKAFIPNLEDKDQINHKNGVKDDNRIDNIEWCNQSENMRHAFDTGLKLGLACEDNGRATLTNEQVVEIKSLYNSGWKIRDLAKKFDIPLGRLRPLFYGFSWEKETTPIERRDERKEWDKEHSINSLISNFVSQYKKRPIVVVAQYDNEGKEIKKYRSINNAAIKTGVPRKSIEANVHNRVKHAGGFLWRKIEVDINQYKELLCES